MIIVEELSQTCGACPSQWEGRVRDGRYIYVRFRHGWLSIGVGETMDAAIGDETYGAALPPPFDGVLTYEELQGFTRHVVSWPCDPAPVSSGTREE